MKSFEIVFYFSSRIWATAWHPRYIHFHHSARLYFHQPHPTVHLLLNHCPNWRLDCRQCGSMGWSRPGATLWPIGARAPPVAGENWKKAKGGPFCFFNLRIFWALGPPPRKGPGPPRNFFLAPGLGWSMAVPSARPLVQVEWFQWIPSVFYSPEWNQREAMECLWSEMAKITLIIIYPLNWSQIKIPLRYIHPILPVLNVHNDFVHLTKTKTQLSAKLKLLFIIFAKFEISQTLKKWEVCVKVADLYQKSLNNRSMKIS